ncbi:MAG: FAD-dependent oxidoreductase, partial [Pseudomonadales bacterium]|nr:FAD-dependent oxidoreductase [Pseudomonadales bacterium]
VGSDTPAIGPCRFGSSVQEIRPDSLVLGDGYVFDFDFVIIATGHTPLAPTRPIPTMPVRGQSIAIESSTALGPVVGGPASLIPVGGGRLLVGGTYANEDDDMAPRESDSKTLAAAAARLLGHEVDVSAAFTGIRCASRDRFPIAGRVPDWLALDDGHIAYDARTLVITGLGSHGATTSPLLGEYLARLVTGESACLPPAVRACLDPARFTRRG